MRPRHVPAHVCLCIGQDHIFLLRGSHAAKDYACREYFDRPFPPQFELPANHKTPTDDRTPIGPRPPQTCQRLTTNRPIESAPGKPCSLIPTSPPAHFRLGSRVLRPSTDRMPELLFAFRVPQARAMRSVTARADCY